MYKDRYKTLSGNDTSLCTYISKDLMCTTAYARQIIDLIRKRIKKADLAKRNQQIILLSDFVSAPDLALKFDLTRQQIYNILKDIKSIYF